MIVYGSFVSNDASLLDRCYRLVSGAKGSISTSCRFGLRILPASDASVSTDDGYLIIMHRR